MESIEVVAKESVLPFELGDRVEFTFNKKDNLFFYGLTGVISKIERYYIPNDCEEMSVDDFSNSENIVQVGKFEVMQSDIERYYPNADIECVENKLYVLRPNEFHPASRKLGYTFSRHLYTIHVDGTNEEIVVSAKHIKKVEKRSLKMEGLNRYEFDQFQKVLKILNFDEFFALNFFSAPEDTIKKMFLRIQFLKSENNISNEEYEKCISLTTRMFLSM